MINTLLLYPSLNPHRRTDGRRKEFILCGLATLTRLLQVNPGWAGHPDRFLQVNTLLLYIPLLALTDRQTDRETNTLASRGLVEPFFQLCCCFSFLFWREIGFGFTYYLCTQSTIKLWCCVSFFRFWREIAFGTYVLSVQYSCAVVSVFLLWRES